MYTLRPYQEDILSKVRSHVAEGRRKILVFAATGAGKTIMAHNIIEGALRRGNRVLFTAHRIQLAEQSAEKFKQFDMGYVQGASKDSSKPLTVGTLQTIINTDMVTPNVIIIDEVHYGFESDMVQSLFERFPDAIFIGLSATPVNERGYLLDGFDAIVDDYQTVDLIKAGALVPFDIMSTPVINTVGLRKTGENYDENELERRVIKEDINRSVVENYMQHGCNKKFICFGVNKKHCKALKDEFGTQGYITEVIDADTPKKKREKILREFHYGTIHGLISIEILTAGFDEPSIKCVILATKVGSWRKYIQMVGRGIRLHPGKDSCILLDMGSNIEEHGMPTDRKSFIFEKKISRVVDRELNLDTDIEARNVEIPEDRKVYLKKIGNILDLYDGKVYSKENDLQEDVNNFLEKTNYFWWRQNSGKMFKDGRWIHFASKSGLPDNSVFYNQTSLFFGLELKLPHGRLTDHQKKTLPEMTQRFVLFFICESVYDVFRSIEHIETNFRKTSSGVTVLNSVYDLPKWQVDLRNKLKIPLYDVTKLNNHRKSE